MWCCFPISFSKFTKIQTGCPAVSHWLGFMNGTLDCCTIVVQMILVDSPYCNSTQRRETQNHTSDWKGSLTALHWEDIEEAADPRYPWISDASTPHVQLNQTQQSGSVTAFGRRSRKRTSVDIFLKRLRCLWGMSAFAGNLMQVRRNLDRQLGAQLQCYVYNKKQCTMFTM